MKHTLLLLLFPYFLFSQTQIGQSFYGEEDYDFLGNTVSISSNGNIIAIAVEGIDDNTGLVRVYENINNVWTQIAQDINSGTVGDWFGTSVSLSSNGNIIAIGAYAFDGNGLSSGLTRVYENINNVWTQLGQDIYRNASGDQLGWSVSLSSNGNIVAMGAPSYFLNGQISGYVKIYENINGNWIQIGSDIQGDNVDDSFGDDISLSSDGRIVAINAPSNDFNGDNSGQVKVYENINNVWTQKGQNLNGDAELDYFGRSISISSNGDIIAIGTINDNGTENIVGLVRVYNYIAGIWTQIGNDINGNIGDTFGDSVCLSSDGSILAIGSYFNDDNANNSGQVKIYKNINDVWTQIGNNINGVNEEDRIGYKVRLSSEGNIIIIGSPFSNDNGNDSGQVKVYDLSEVLSSDEFVLSQFSLYPNPAQNQVNIQLQEGITLKKVTIYNTLGQFVSTSKEKIINTTNLSSGMYLVEIETNQGKATKQIVIE
ncbi:T9SS type A sorting domain-containing protein [Xanthomarina gelatinilytica]|uniref:T9SS type A sorting domain-containing protein n=1 Tax=Xanthomarina gelatinilytica TaxID=1137281 RepID=UPI003AA96AEB